MTADEQLINNLLKQLKLTRALINFRTKNLLCILSILRVFIFMSQWKEEAAVSVPTTRALPFHNETCVRMCCNRGK